MSGGDRGPNFDAFAKTYQSQFIATIQQWDFPALERVAEVFIEARARGNCVLMAGNGGSAAVATHSECDASKGTSIDGLPTLNTRSLSANTSVLTALGNDLGYASVFSKQVEYYGKPGDVLLLVSSSGNSENVVEACKVAKARGLTTVAFVGFSGGTLKSLADHVVHVAIHNYGIVEDMHQACIHLVTQYMRERFRTES